MPQKYTSAGSPYDLGNGVTLTDDGLGVVTVTGATLPDILAALGADLKAAGSDDAYFPAGMAIENAKVAFDEAEA